MCMINDFVMTFSQQWFDININDFNISNDFQSTMIWYSINDFDLSTKLCMINNDTVNNDLIKTSMTLIYQQWLHIYSWVWICFMNLSEYVSWIWVCFIDLSMFHWVWVCFIEFEYVSLNLIYKISVICMFRVHYTMLITIDSNEVRLMRNFCSKWQIAIVRSIATVWLARLLSVCKNDVVFIVRLRRV